MLVDLKDAIVTYYPSRTARVAGIYMDEPRQTPTIQEFETELNLKAGLPGEGTDEVFEIVRPDKPRMCVLFTDDRVLFGREVVVEDWDAKPTSDPAA